MLEVASPRELLLLSAGFSFAAAVLVAGLPGEVVKTAGSRIEAAAHDWAESVRSSASVSTHVLSSPHGSSASRGAKVRSASSTWSGRAAGAWEPPHAA